MAAEAVLHIVLSAAMRLAASALHSSKKAHARPMAPPIQVPAAQTHALHTVVSSAMTHALHMATAMIGRVATAGLREAAKLASEKVLVTTKVVARQPVELRIAR
jgi:hypothetical protein